MSDYVLYIISLDSKSVKRTYVGITNNLERRLRQHNGEIKGGAKCTTSVCGLGEWELVAVVEGLSSKQVAMQLEWRMHHPLKRKSGIDGRISNLQECLSMDRWTKNSPLLCDLSLKVTYY